MDTATRAIISNDIALSIRERIRPPLKWAGGKGWLVSHLRTLWAEHSHRRLVEPFCGGLAVALGLMPEHALLNDINPHSINLYRQLQAGLRTELSLRNEADYYYERRKEFNALVAEGKADSSHVAALFYYLNRTAYNGLCRFNKTGKFNVPFGKYATIKYKKDFAAYQQVLKGWEFSAVDFQDVTIQPEDFVYADPPYDGVFSQYTKEGFSWDDQERLAMWLALHPGPVVVSNRATERIRALYKKLGFKLQLLEAPRRISCTGDRTKAREVLATRNIKHVWT